MRWMRVLPDGGEFSAAEALSGTKVRQKEGFYIGPVEWSAGIQSSEKDGKYWMRLWAKILIAFVLGAAVAK